MKLKKIKIQNFRCFKNYEIDFRAGVTVLIGKNGVGKTSLLNAIRYGLSVFFSNDSKMGDDLLILGNPDLKVISTNPTDFYRERHADMPSADLSIGMEASFNGISLQWEYYKRSTSGASLFTSKYQDAYRSMMDEYHRSDKLPLFVFYSDSFPHIGTKSSDFAKTAIKNQESIIRNFAYYKWSSEVACTSIWQNRFINSLLKVLSLRDGAADMVREVEYVKNKLKQFSKPINTLGTDKDEFIIEDFFPLVDDDKLFLYLHLKNGKDVIFDNLPAGYNRLFSIAFDLAYRLFILRKDNIEEPHGIAIIDEVDLHLHPTLEQEVIERLQRTFPTIQFIVSTHSPLVLSNLKTKNSDNMIFKMEENDVRPKEMPDMYGIDYSSAVYDFMETPYVDSDVHEEVEAIIRLERRGKHELAAKRKEELKEMVSEIQFKNLIEKIEKRLADN